MALWFTKENTNSELVFYDFSYDNDNDLFFLNNIIFQNLKTDKTLVNCMVGNQFSCKFNINVINNYYIENIKHIKSKQYYYTNSLFKKKIYFIDIVCNFEVVNKFLCIVEPFDWYVGYYENDILEEKSSYYTKCEMEQLWSYYKILFGKMDHASRSCFLIVDSAKEVLIDNMLKNNNISFDE